jgi:hypothetical protein
LWRKKGFGGYIPGNRADSEAAKRRDDGCSEKLASCFRHVAPPQETMGGTVNPLACTAKAGWP